MAGHMDASETELVECGSPSSNNSLIVEDASGMSTLLSEIQSKILCLIPTVDAARVGLTSKPLRAIWHSLPILIFDYYRFPEMDSLKIAFEKFISDTLACHDESAIKILEIRLCPTFYCDILIRNEWIAFAAEHNVQKLVLYGNMFETEIHMLPHSIFSCQYLVKLELAVLDILLTWPDTYVLPNLRKLNLKFIVLPESFFNQLSSFPVLEKLSMFFCNILFSGAISVSSMTLTEFIMCDCPRMETCSVMLEEVPNLAKFIYICYYYEGNELKVPGNVFQLVINGEASHVNTQSPNDFSQTLFKVTKELLNKEYLVISKWLIEYLSRVPNLWRQMSFNSFIYLILLNISIWPVTKHVRVLMQLIGRCPSLKTVSIYIVDPPQREAVEVVNVEEFLENCNCNGVCRDLTNIRIDNFGGDETEMLLVRSLLANTPELLLLRIRMNLFMVRNDMNSKINRILEFEKSSSAADVLFD